MNAAGLRQVLLAALLLTLAGCGFTLRGSDAGSLPLSSLRLQAPPASETTAVLERALLDAGVSVSEVEPEQTAETGAYTLRLTEEQLNERVTSVNTRARTAGSELTLSVTATLLQGSEIVAGPQTLSVQREYFEESATISGSSRERESLIGEMRTELAAQVLQSLQSVTEALRS